MRILITGGRQTNFSYESFCQTMEIVMKQIASGILRSETTIISGGAKGIDTMAARFAKDYKTQHEEYPAHWDTEMKAAGPKRNQRMIDEGKPDIAIAFPGGVGTADMVKRIKKHKIKLIEIKDNEI